MHDELIKQYGSCGFAWPIELFSEAEAQSHYRRLVDYEKLNGPMHYRVKPYLIFSSAWEIATQETLLDAVESVLGENILLWDSAYVIKEPASSGFISWHQDLTYWGLDSASDDDIVSAWVALTPVTKANGCIQVVKGSHRGTKFTHNDTFNEDNLLHRGQTIEKDFDLSDIEYLEMQAGCASLHHGWAVHSSLPNKSSQRRVGLVMNYIKPSVTQVVGTLESATLVRGQDTHQHFVPEPACGIDNAPFNVKIQQQAERSKHEVYDKA